MEELEKRSRVAELSLAQVTKYCQQGNFSRAFPHYLVFAQLEKERFLRDHVEPFLSVTNKFVQQLKSLDSTKILSVYEEAVKLLPTHSPLQTSYGTQLFLSGNMKKAESAFKAAITADPENIEAKDKLENLWSTLLERWHFPMLNDRGRNSRYQAAISKLVAGGCNTVLDIGTGTGLLSLMATQAGAEKVFACEASEVMAATARDVLLINQEKRVRLIQKLSTDMTSSDVPERLSLLVTETFDSGLLGEHVLQSVYHAIQNFLTPEYRVVPRAANFYIVPIQSKYVRDNTIFSRENLGYLTLTASRLRVLADMKTGEGERLEPYLTEDLTSIPGGFKFLSPPQRLFSVDFQDVSNIKTLLEGETFSNVFTVDCEGECDALAGYFDLILDEEEENIISTGVESQSCWDQVIFPLTTSSRTVHKQSQIKVECLVRKHIALRTISIEHDLVEVNGNGVQGEHRDPPTEEMLVSPLVVRQLNTESRAGLGQWLAYYLVRDLRPTNVLDLTSQFPACGLQILKLGEAGLSLRINPSQRRASRQLLDLVTTIASQNDIAESRVDCLTSLSVCPGEEKYEVILVSPVSPSGRLDQDCLLEMAEVRSLLNPASHSLILPARLQLWCQLVASPELLARSRLVSDQAVLGFKISEQVNMLAVSHQQDLLYSTLQKTELSPAVLVTDLAVSTFSLERREVSQTVEISQSGKVSAVVYWFVQDFGWELSVNTRDSQQFRQAAVLCQEEITVAPGDPLTLSCQLEAGLLDFKIQNLNS